MYWQNKTRNKIRLAFSFNLWEVLFVTPFSAAWQNKKKKHSIYTKWAEELQNPSSTDGACCAAFEQKTSYQWDNKKRQSADKKQETKGGGGGGMWPFVCVS